MRLKSYFAGTVEAAMALARQELGPDAMLVQSRKATAETRHLGEYEVVFAVAPQQAADAAPADGENRAAPSRDEVVARLSADITHLKKQIESLAGAVAHSRPGTSAKAVDAGVSRILAALIEADMNRSVAGEIASGLRGDVVDEGFDPALLDLIHVDATLGRPDSERAIVALVGPPGAGKTTTLVKLATIYGVAARRPARIISTDVFRIAATEQLRSYAAILGVGFESVETGFALAQALEEGPARQLVLIDTPGLAESDLDDAADITEFVSRHPDIDVHLTLPASMRIGDMERAFERYSRFGPDKLIFTKLDETSSHGPLASLPRTTGKPASFLSGGQQIPEDLEPATRGRIAELVFGPLFEREKNTCAIAG
jgi:flagellar biosynthesis protein FlhF